VTFITRFAPSPTGPLHLGHAYSALLASDMARKSDGTFLLRIEDIDPSRSRPQWEEQIYSDLSWMGLTWPQPVLRQSDRLNRYQQAVQKLIEMGLVYPCCCNRADIEAAAGAPQEGVPKFGPDGRIYPGTCRGRSIDQAAPGDVLRLDMRKAIQHVKVPRFEETGAAYSGVHQFDADRLIGTVGDIVLVRRGMGGSYHLSVVVDDADQGITHVVRGADLFDATQIHVVLQHLLDLPVPIYHHHDLIRDETGKRLAKRDDARAILRYREDGITPADLRQRLNL